MVKKENNEQRVLGLLSAGHGFSDVNQSALTALLPYLVYANGYDLAKVSVLVMASNLAGSVAQPVFGWMVDKKNQNWMLWLSIFLACGGIALCGTTSSFFLLCVYAMISGIGVAMFHPQAASMVNRISKLKKEGKNISLFSLGGKLGYTFGPMLITLGITRFGTKGTLVFFIPAVIYGILWRKWIRKFDDSTQERNDLKRLEKVEKKRRLAIFFASLRGGHWTFDCNQCFIHISRALFDSDLFFSGRFSQYITFCLLWRWYFWRFNGWDFSGPNRSGEIYNLELACNGNCAWTSWRCQLFIFSTCFACNYLYH